ncbi:hypothetical protein [Rhodoferax sp. GW822-FHT02A01]|uniref:hypothetical protein n=1 Tax=Rhodoferax sp. GW822-FHT02A01 TaxID=3141537 RepID=UPI00315CBF6E
MTHMRWPTVADMEAMVPAPQGYSLEFLHRKDILTIIELIKSWHPSVSVGASAPYSREAFYLKEVSLRGESETDVAVCVIRKGEEVIGMSANARDQDTLTIQNRLTVICPAHRKGGVFHWLFQLLEPVGRAMGCEYSYAMVTLHYPPVQMLCEQFGYQLAGIVPGFDRELVAPGVVKRVYEALYAKPLVAEAELLFPDKRQLLPKVAALLDQLYPVAAKQQS